MSHDHQQVISDVLRDMPLASRLAHLVASVLIDDKPAISIEVLCDIALVMAKHLPVEQQTQIVWHLNEVASELRARWN